MDRADSTGERDHAVERLLRQSLKTPAQGGVTGACPDAETLAAWTDGGLSGSVLEDIQRHVADCARCQDVAGTLARIHASVHPPEPVRSPRRWLAWLVPLTAVAAAIALWFAVPGNLGEPAGKNEIARVSQAPPQGRFESQSKAVQPAPAEPAAPPPVVRRQEQQSAAAREAPQAASAPGALEGRTQFQSPQQPAAAANAPGKDEEAAKKAALDDLAKEKIEAAGAATAPGAVASASRPAAAPLAARSDAARSAVTPTDTASQVDPPLAEC